MRSATGSRNWLLADVVLRQSSVGEWLLSGGKCEELKSRNRCITDVQPQFFGRLRQQTQA